MIDNILRAATCRVSCGDESGTGHLVTDCYVLTARHCVIEAIESGKAITLTFYSSEGDINFPGAILAHSEEMDACILSLPESLLRPPIPLTSTMPREGGDWRSFGYPEGKTVVGHRVSGTISHLLDAPKLRMDIDLTIDPATALHSYRGLSGAAVVSEGVSRGMIRLKVDGTLGAISVQQMEEFLSEHGIQISQPSTDETASAEPHGSLADRSIFQKTFEQMIANNPGDYVFLEGAPGIGKTTFCHEFKSEDRALYNLGTYSLASQGRGPGSVYRAQPEVFFDWLSTAVSTLIAGRASRKEERRYATLVQETSALLNAFSDYCTSKRRRGILFLDGLNEVQTADPETLMKLVGLLPQSLPQEITIVLTSPNYHSVAVLLAGRVKSQNILPLPPLSDEASSAYCWHELAEERATSALVARICEKAKGHPLYLRYLIEYANSNIEDTFDDFPILTGSIEQYYESLWPKLLEDGHATHLLAIMARLRWGIGTSDLLKALTTAEQAVFISTISRIRHLLLSPDKTTIYHSSFTEFLVSKTGDLNLVVQKRLAEFCIRESCLDYCVLNVVFHLLRSNNSHRSRAVVACNQKWVDTCVALGVEPDTILFDIEATLTVAMQVGPPVEVIRLLLLSQRVGFRYNTLFAQSARLIAEALIALKRPQEALKHAIRYNTLIVNPDDALQIALRLIQHEYRKEGMELLRLLYQKILEAHVSEKVELQDFIHLCRLHLRTVLFMRLAEGGGRMRQVKSILDYAAQNFKNVLAEAPPEFYEECFSKVYCVGTGYFLCFHDTYTGLAQLKERVPEAQEGAHHFFQIVIFALLECADSLEIYNLPKEIVSLQQVFSDIEEHVIAGACIDKQLVPIIVDTLIQLGAPLSVVDLLADKGEKFAPKPLKIRADNGVDVDFPSIHQCAAEWRINAFLEKDFGCPMVGSFDKSGWFLSLDQLTRALFCCEGKIRRAKADGDESLQLQLLEFLKTRVFKPLEFTLAQRVKWQDSYAIPENVLPLIYGNITLVLMDCYPKELPVFLQNLSKRAVDQCGLYSEGFRGVAFAVLQRLLIRKIEGALFDEVFNLLQHVKEHVIHGLENRHELVPELLKLIPLFVKVGAAEEAEGLYQYMLGVSMGPSWYKEDQLGLMVNVLRNIPLSDNVETALPLIAGYLERASGEMTFQRFVRYEKHSLIEELFRRGRFVSGCRYFKRQTCGNTAELLSECQHGMVDKPSPMVGMRFPGGALDEQHAILEMVRNTQGLDWRVRWALLEIFQFGDERHLDNFAIEYARLVKQTGIEAAEIPEMVNRVEFVVGADIDPEDRSQFLSSFERELGVTHRQAFSEIICQLSSENSLGKLNVPVAEAAVVSSKTKDVSRDDNVFYFPGIFGKQSALKEAENLLTIAESHLKLRNIAAAKIHAVKTLRTLQEGGWSIWGNLSGSASRAEEILRDQAENASQVISAYAPLLEAERYEQKWRLAEHLISKITDLLLENERNALLQHVIDHIHLMVGEATSEIEKFSILNEETPINPSVEIFRLVLWCLDHPSWLRREKAAGMAAWLLECNSIYFNEAVKEAFSMKIGYSSDMLCGFFDNLSSQQPQHLWDQIFKFLDMEVLLGNCRHVGRLVVLHRIAKRAADVGSSTASEVASCIEEQFRSGIIALSTPDRIFNCPSWASCISHEWASLNQFGVLSKELIQDFEQKLAHICMPLDVQGGRSLENAVSDSYNQVPNRHLNRWEAKVRFALNTALFPYVSKLNFREIELVLRIFNPALPEQTLKPNFASPARTAINAISSRKDYDGAICNKEYYFLNYHEVTKRGKDDTWVYIEVLAVVVPVSSVRRGFFLPSTETLFRSKEYPDFSSIAASHETCCRLEPGFTLFGSFTPAFPLPSFRELIKGRDCDFIRTNWRNGRSNDDRYCGRALQEGCLLAVKRSAVRLPDGKKLAWIIKVDGKTVTMVDAQNILLI